MDPALQRLVEEGPLDEDVAVMLRLAAPDAEPPPGVRIVTRFGAFATARVARGQAAALREEPTIRSVKAPRLYRPELVRVAAEDVEPRPTDARAGEPLPATGRGVVVGIVDWGLDFRHPAFRDAGGATRVEALWDQTAPASADPANRFGYGVMHWRGAIDMALGAEDPIAALGYDPTVWDVGAGTHGTATASVAAGSPWRGGLPGVAPEADIVFVNLTGAGPLGHSTTIAEAVDFVRETAGDRPWVVNLSLGRTGGPHDGRTLLEQLLDAAIQASRGVIVNSGGNYFASGVHTTGRLLSGDSAEIPLDIRGGLVEIHEIDLWYAGADRMVVGIASPDGRSRALTRPGERTVLTLDGAPAATVVHRLGDPNNGRNEVVVRIDPAAPTGTWQLLVTAIDGADGRYHAWIEREALKPGLRARFAPQDAVVTTTTGTICNGRRNIAVGAFDPHDPDRPLTHFSSSGDTVDGRRKPDIVAPGELVLAARSGARDELEPSAATRMSGTSLAAPHVTGTVACLLQLTGRQPAKRLRDLLLRSAERFDGEDEIRAGNGYLDAAGACALAIRVRGPMRHGRSDHLRRESEMATLTEPMPTITPDAARQRLGLSPRGLFEVFVLNRRPGDRERLEALVEQVVGAGERVEGDPQPGDLLVRGAMGEGHALMAVLVTGELLDMAAAAREGFDLEGTLPGLYAWVTEDGVLRRERDDRFARRICDRQRYLPSDQTLLRLRDSSVPAPTPATTPPASAGEGLDEAVNRRSPEYVRWYQAALNRIDGAGLAVDGIAGPLTRAAVARYQARKGLAADGIVGPITERALMMDGAGLPPGFTDPTPVTPAQPAPASAVRLRRDVTTLSDAELAALAAAINTLRTSGRYRQYVVDHNTGVPDAHRQPGFLPWHRQFILFFESELRSIDPSVTLPYWNWARDSGRLGGAPMWNQQMQRLCGGNGVVTTGPFAGWLEIGPDGRDTSQPLHREFGVGMSDLPTQSDVDAALRETVYDLPRFNEIVRGGFRNTLEGFVPGVNLHNTVHMWIGGSMAPMTSPNDPCFFLHHCFIDKVWADWQARSPQNLTYLPAITTPTVTGNGQVNAWGIDDAVRVRGLNTASPITYTARATLDVANLRDHTGATVSVRYA